MLKTTKSSLMGLLTALLLSCATLVSAQNLQLHFDPRHALYPDQFDRNYLTITFEMFKPDKWGSTFMFVDLDLNQPKSNVGLAYLEIARDFKMGKCPVQAHIEYNGGLVLGQNMSGFTINSAYLGGLSYSNSWGGVILSTYLVYKYHAFEHSSHDAQWTVTWNKDFLKGKLSLSGFFDMWTENKVRTNAGFVGGKRLVILTEPQFWYNPTEHFSVGTEVEISNNFVSGGTHAFVIPTLAVKWRF